MYDSLVRERGDVVTEARVVAEQAQHQARQALDGHHWAEREARPPAS
ncbi:hypothetical protein ABZ848_03350 [Streptomyces sp. NPDC047081]